MSMAKVMQTELQMILQAARQFLAKCRRPALASQEEPRHAVMITQEELQLLEKALREAEFLRLMAEAERIRKEDAAVYQAMFAREEARRLAQKEMAKAGKEAGGNAI